MPEPVTMYALLKEFAAFAPMVVLIAVAYVVSKMNTIERAVTDVKESVTYLKVWTDMHEKNDVTMFDSIKGRIESVEDKLGRLENTRQNNGIKG